jgi:hypothetical protein
MQICDSEYENDIQNQNETKKKGKRKKMIKTFEIEQTTEIIKKKTKGAKIIDCLIPAVSYAPTKINNVILHLKCTINEIDNYINKSNWKFNVLSYDPSIPKDIIAYDNNKNFGDYSSFSSSLNELPETNNNNNIPSDETSSIKQPTSNLICNKCKSSYEETNNTQLEQDQQKIKQLKIHLYKNQMQDKKADCFWCTCAFDNDPCYILQYGFNNEIYGHGSYCSPECAVAFLFGKQQLWDDSAKTESFQLMNYYYGKPNGYQQSIKPALSPYYFLDKYYGNLTIQEYRRLTKSQHMMLVVEKPITRILPEIHEDNDNLIMGGGNNYNNCGKYKVKKQSEKPAGVSRNTILREKFGLSK